MSCVGICRRMRIIFAQRSFRVSEYFDYLQDILDTNELDRESIHKCLYGGTRKLYLGMYFHLWRKGSAQRPAGVSVEPPAQSAVDGVGLLQRRQAAAIVDDLQLCTGDGGRDLLR